MASEKTPAVIFQALVVCDDIRFENNGKLLLIGVYSDTVQVFKLPLQLRSLGLAVRAKVMSAGRIRFSVSATDPQGNSLLEANGEMNYDGEPGRTIWLPIVMGPALLTTEGNYSVRVALGDAPAIHESFAVKKAPTPEPPAPPLPPN
ncbi:MAG TPA: hypothetical protein VKG01_14390 [Thermoanaerobaculia bacterium]|nr:hypothetical protein [Thermoanaerobaculia bacterium]